MKEAKNDKRSDRVRRRKSGRERVENVLGWLLVSLAFSILLAIFIGVHIYIYRRLAWGMGLEAREHLWILRMTITFLAFSFFLARILTRVYVNPLTVGLDWIASIWWGAGLYLFLFSLLGHVVAIGLRFYGMDFSPGGSPGIHGRHIILIATAVLTVAVSAFGVVEAFGKAHVTRFTAEMKNLPPDMEGFKVVQITDLHLAEVANASLARKMVEHVNALKPDLILMTGDFIDAFPPQIPDIFEEMSKLHAKYGVLASTGNHEFYIGVKAVVKYSADINILYLRNEKAIIADKLLVYGIDDPTVKRMGGKIVPFEDVIGPESAEMPAILMYHRPKKLKEAARLGIDLMLCGHTHNGQLWPLKYIVHFFFPMITGHFHDGGCHLYVSRGLGFWGPPMRVGSTPEIVEITLINRRKKP